MSLGTSLTVVLQQGDVHSMITPQTKGLLVKYLGLPSWFNLPRHLSYQQ